VLLLLLVVVVVVSLPIALVVSRDNLIHASLEHTRDARAAVHHVSCRSAAATSPAAAAAATRLVVLLSSSV